MDLPQLRDFIVAYFDDNELRDLCFDLGIDYESLPGEGKAAKARELVKCCQRRDRLAELEAACLRLRPDVSNMPAPVDRPSANSAANQSAGVTGRDKIAADTTSSGGSESTPSPPPSDLPTAPIADSGTIRPLRVFLCHASADKPAVRELYQRLYADGIDAWLDEENLLPGQDWQRIIPKAVRDSDVVIVCLSQGSINKAGYVQKEIKFALDVADEQPEDTIFLIPLKLEECNVPERLSRWQWVDLFSPNGYERLMRALHLRANALNRLSTLDHAARRVLDAAIPKRVPVKKPTELMVLIRQTDSDGLKAMLKVDNDDLVKTDDIRSKDFPLMFPSDPNGNLQGASLALKVTAPDFEPKVDQKTILVPPKGDSEICRFLLIPQYTGNLVVNLEAFQGETNIASQLLQTNGEPSDREPIPLSYKLVTLQLPVISYLLPVGASGSSRFGGVDVDAGQLSAGQDVVGRDKIISVHAESGATVIVGQQPLPQRRKVVVWWNAHSTKIKAAYIGGMFVLLAALIGLMQPIVSAWVTGPSTAVVPPTTATVTVTPTETPTKTPTPTLTPTPMATVRAFSIINGKVIDVVKPNERADVALGERIIVRAEVSTNTALTDLLFIWHTCERSSEIVIYGYGVSEMPYEAPSATVSDCIRVRIEKGGRLLDDSSIFVEVK